MPRKMHYRKIEVRTCRRCGQEFDAYGKLAYCQPCRELAYQQKMAEARRRYLEKQGVGIESGVNELWCQVHLRSLLPVTCIIYSGQDFVRLVKTGEIWFGFFERWDGGNKSTVYQVIDGHLEKVKDVRI